LTLALEKWQLEGAELILMLDANKPLGDRPGGLGNLVGRHSLINLSKTILHANENVTTYARGSKKIDFIFGTRRVEKFCEGAGLVPFGFGYPSNHRALFIQINIGKILNANVSAIESRHAWKLQNVTPKDWLKFLETVFNHYQQQISLRDFKNYGQWNQKTGVRKCKKNLRNAMNNTSMECLQQKNKFPKVKDRHGRQSLERQF
jgi:hypothetical protein